MVIKTLATEFVNRVTQLRNDHKEDYLCYILAEEMFENQIDFKKTTLLKYSFIDGSSCELCNNNKWN